MLYCVKFFHNDYPISLNKPTILYTCSPHPQISTHPQSHNFKQLPPWINAPTLSSLTFLNSKNKRKAWFYCYFIYTFLCFNYRRIVFFSFPVTCIFIFMCLQSSFMCRCIICLLIFVLRLRLLNNRPLN